MHQSDLTATSPGSAASLPAPALHRHTDSRSRRRPPRLRLADGLTSLLMVGPALAAIVAFILIPILVAGRLSLTDWDGFSERAEFLGLANYEHLFQDPYVANAAYVTVVIAVAGTVACNVLGLGLALMLDGAGRTKVMLRG